MLEASHLSIRFPAERAYTEPVSDLSFSVKQGEILALMGPSGCGKTVLCTSLLGMLEYPGFVHSGRIRLSPPGGSALDLLDLSEGEWQKLRGKAISLIFQNPLQALNHARTIGDHFVESIRAHEPTASKAACLTQAETLLDTVLFSRPKHLLRMYPFELSGGMCQRVLIGMSLIHRPALLIADEPTTALDMRSETAVLRLFTWIRETYHTTILLVSHDTRAVSRTADRVLNMGLSRE